MNTTLSLAPTEVLHRQYRWMRAGLPLMVAVCGLLVTLAGLWIAHPSWQKWEKWGSLQTWWLVGVTISLAAGLVLWLFRRWSLVQSARRIDERLHSLNRLETATEFSKFDDPLVRAQREETAEFLRHAPVQKRLRRFPWLVLAIVLLLVGHLATLLLWIRPWIRPAVVAKKTEHPALAPLPKASIKWKSPKAETKAAPIEEVPLEATADSASGLHELFLEVSVNGEPKLSAPVEVADLNKPGARPIQTSIYLDQLEVKPYDMVAYFLRARRIVAETEKREVPETVSPVQFVQVKPFRDDVREEMGGGGMPGEEAQSILRLIKAMKVAQLRLIKENFTLAHAEIAHDQPDWQKENARVGSEQGVLEKKAGDILQVMIQRGAPAEMVNLITQAQPLIDDAAKKITATQNKPALPVQQKALALITEIEKFLIQVIQRSQDSSGRPQADIKDPFEKQRDVELKQRAETQAGELELLAREQARLADDLAKNSTASDAPAPGAKPDKNKITGTPAERQTQISQRVGALLNGENFEPEITGHLEKGRDEARESLRQLDAEDPARAREPAATAARELRLAVEAMNRAGEAKAQQQMQAALQDVSKAADDARGAPQQGSDQQAREAAEKAAKEAEQTRRDLADAAQKQQETGSREAAERMAAMANALNDPKLRDELRKLRDQPRDQARANAAADRLDEITQRRMDAAQSGKAGLSPEQLSELIERMDRARANLQRLAETEAAQQQQGNQPGQRQPGSPEDGQQQTGDQKGQPSQTGEQAQQGSREHNGQAEQPGQRGQQGQRGQGEQAQQGNEGQQGSDQQQGQGREQGQQSQTGQQRGGQQAQGQGQQPGESQTSGQQAGNAQTQRNGQATQGGARGNSQTQQSSNDAQSQSGSPTATQARTQSQSARGGGVGAIRSSGGGYANDTVRENFARELLDEVRDVVDSGVRSFPDSPQLTEQAELVRRELGHWRQLPPEGRVQVIYRGLEKPMAGVLDFLRAELQRSARKHQLTNQQADQAPPAYRAAVEDYFERLSKDYEAAPEK